MNYSYQFLLAAIANKLTERINMRGFELDRLEALVASHSGGQPTTEELSARARLLALNGQISKLSRALESISDATTHGGAAQ